MIALVSITTLVIATVFALAVATAFQWLLLRVAVFAMQPATASRPRRSGLAQGTGQLARAFAPHR